MSSCVQSRVRENGDWQSIELPLAIDLTGPKFESMNAQRNDDGTLTSQLLRQGSPWPS